MSDPKCPGRHKRAGIVTTHPDGLAPEDNGPHYAASCCGKEECIREIAAAAYVATGIRGVYRADRLAMAFTDILERFGK